MMIRSKDYLNYLYKLTNRINSHEDGRDHPPLVNDPFIQLNGKQESFYSLVFMTFSNPL